ICSRAPVENKFHGASRFDRYPQRLAVSNAWCLRTRGAARRQPTISWRTGGVRFERGSLVNWQIELRMQQRGKLLQSERLLQYSTSSVASWQTRYTIPRRKNERTGARGEKVGDRINSLQAQIHVEDSAVDPFAADQLQGGRNFRGGTRHIVAEFRQHRFQGERNERLILNDQNTLSLGQSLWSGGHDICCFIT